MGYIQYSVLYACSRISSLYQCVLFGMYGSAMLAGNFHGVEIAPMLIIASVVNLFFWTLVCYAALSAFRKFAS